jgi:N-acetylglucosamine kinase-like BadF-type ATPase
MPRYALAVAGSTVESVAAVATLEGDLVAVASGRPLNLQETRLIEFYNALQDLLRTFSSIPDWPANCHGVWLNVGGVLDEYDMRSVAQSAGSTQLHEAHLQLDRNLVVPLESDRGQAAQEAAFWGGNGLVVKAGTAAFVYGRDESGVAHRAGGWGPHTDADGGGFWIGRTALSTLFRDYDGRRHLEPAFRSTVFKILGIERETQIIRWVAEAGANHNLRAGISGLARVVVDAADRLADRTSRRILSDAVARIVLSIDAVRERFPDVEGMPISLQGGLLQNSLYMTESLVRLLRRDRPGLLPEASQFRVTVGALALALKRFSRPEAIDRLRQSVESCDASQVPFLHLKYQAEITKLLSGGRG